MNALRTGRGGSLAMTRAGSLLCLYLLCLAPGTLAGETRETADAPPWVKARVAVVSEYPGGAVLLEKNADLAMPPASLAKLMTLHIALLEMEAGRLSGETVVTIRPEETGSALPPGSALMYLRPGMLVTVRELMLGLAVASGNDAALALSRRISGSTPRFVSLMNAEAQAMGLSRLSFADPSGLSARNLATGRELAAFARLYMRAHPAALAELHSVREFEFPGKAASRTAGGARGTANEFRNRNPLVFSYPGCDGLKTGYTDESGYNLISTAERDGTRFVAVTMGGPGTGKAGEAAREADSSRLLDWAFRTWRTARPEVPEAPELRVWTGKPSRIRPLALEELAATVRKASTLPVTVRYEFLPEIIAPLRAGDKVGEALVCSGMEVIRRIPMVSAIDVPRGGFLRRAADAAGLFFHRLFAKKNT